MKQAIRSEYSVSKYMQNPGLHRQCELSGTERFITAKRTDKLQLICYMITHGLFCRVGVLHLAVASSSLDVYPS